MEYTIQEIFDTLTENQKQRVYELSGLFCK